MCLSSKLDDPTCGLQQRIQSYNINKMPQYIEGHVSSQETRIEI